MLLAVLGLLFIIAGCGAWMWLDHRRSSSRAVDRELPRLHIPLTSRALTVRVPDQPVVRTPESPAANGNGRHPPAEAEHELGDEPVLDIPARGGQSLFAEPPSTDTVRFQRPQLEALQLLPGRLEVLGGLPEREDIRFVRAPGGPMQIVLGREPGTSPQHVRFDSPTVSRLHARLSFANGGWTIANLSDTNPIVVNDQELRDGDRPLTDGDRIELGEVILRYHAR
ncbi:MAG: FHA domain-containing protein [Gemmatimonadota bacterium]|nr:FHA domain-containing protein [Gemmatimonadota bacterium]